MMLYIASMLLIVVCVESVHQTRRPCHFNVSLLSGTESALVGKVCMEYIYVNHYLYLCNYVVTILIADVEGIMNLIVSCPYILTCQS